MQGYNAQAAVTAEQIVVAAEVSIESLDTANLQPMVDTARRQLEAAGVTDKPGVVLADAGYWKNEAIEAIVAEGIPTLVAPDADRRREPRPGRRGGLYDFTRRVLATDWGKQLYPEKAGRRRAHLRPDQVKSRRQPLLTPRQTGRQVGMAPPDRDPQPAQAPPAPTRSRLRLPGDR